MAATLVQRIAYSNPNKAAMLLRKYQYNRPLNNVNDLATGLSNLSNSFGEKAQLEIVKLHPDYDVIVACNDKLKTMSADGGNETIPASSDAPVTENSIKLLGYSVDKKVLKGIGIGVVVFVIFMLLVKSIKS